MSNNSIEDAAMAACENIGITYKAFPFDGQFHVVDATDGKLRNGAGRLKLVKAVLPTTGRPASNKLFL